MNKTLLFFFLLLSFGTATAYHQSCKQNEVVKKDASIITAEPFGLNLQIDQLANDQFNLVATIELANGSYIISPFSKDSVYGHFSLAIAEASNFIINDPLLETPNSVEEFDPILEEPVKFVRENTTYKQQLKVIEEGDFEVSGLIEFVLEPICIPYDIEFTISYHSGVMTVKKTKTSISKEYKL